MTLKLANSRRGALAAAILNLFLIGSSTHVAAGALDSAYYPRHLVPEAILNESARREASYVRTLALRHEQRLEALTRLSRDRRHTDATALEAWNTHIAALQHELLLSLGVLGPQAQPQVRSQSAWVWHGPWKTSVQEVQGQPVPRTDRSRHGLMQRIELASPFGPDVGCIVVKSGRANAARGSETPRRVPIVICLPDIDPFTGLAGRKENLLGEARIRALISSGFAVAVVDLPGLRDLSDVEMKKGLLLGQPLLGRAAAELSLLVTYVSSRDDIDPGGIGVHAAGWGGFAATLAAALDERITALATIDGQPSFRGFIARGEPLEGLWLIPRFLRYADSGHLVCALAPRPLLILGSEESIAEAQATADRAYTFYDARSSFTARPLAEKERANIGTEIAGFFGRAFAAAPGATARRAPPELPAELQNDKPVSITEITSAAEWRKTAPKLRDNIARLLGGFPDRGADHSGTVVERGEEKDFRWERVIVRTTPDTLMPVIITRSEKVPARAPAMVHISGYSISHEHDALRLAGEMASHGIVGVFACPKTATNYRLGSTPHDAVGIMEGRPVVAEWAWNLMGLIDYLQTRPDIDSARLGAMGWSLGATTISYWLPFDERLKLGVGFVAFNQMRGLMNQSRTGNVSMADGASYLQGHPLFNFIPEILRYGDVDDLMATIAPRPLLSLAGEKDEYFPHAVVRDIHRRQQHIYRLLRAADRHELLVYPGPHDLAPPLRERAWDFLERWLKKR